MSAVIEMKAWKASHARKTAPVPAASTGEMLYFCTVCNSERFRIFESGLVRCAECDAELRRTPPSILTLSVLSLFVPVGLWWYARSKKP